VRRGSVAGAVLDGDRLKTVIGLRARDGLVVTRTYEP